MLVVQQVTILWTKATRGAPRANERTSLPRAFVVEPCSALCLIQHYRMAEWNQFDIELQTSQSSPQIPGAVDALRLRPTPEKEIVLGFGSHSGQPVRHPVNQAATLRAGQWAQLIVNARHTSYSGQHYSEDIFNVAYGDGLPPDVFLRGEPDYLIDLKADLF